jgi:hypothetical protein
MRAVRRRPAARDFELEPLTPLEMMDATIECKQELKAVVRCSTSHIIC